MGGLAGGLSGSVRWVSWFGGIRGTGRIWRGLVGFAGWYWGSEWFGRFREAL